MKPDKFYFEFACGHKTFLWWSMMEDKKRLQHIADLAKQMNCFQCYEKEMEKRDELCLSIQSTQ